MASLMQGFKRAQPISSFFSRSFASQAKTFKFEVETPYSLHVPKNVDASKFTGPRRQSEATAEELESMFRLMTTIRRVEIVSDQQYKQRMIRGFCHLYSGEEAICTGFEYALTKQDSIITAYRDHGNQLARGDTPASVFAELFGRVTGCSKGKGGSMHMYRRATNFFGGNGIVGAQGPVGAGLAFTHKYNGKDNVSVVCYGDGAANQGQLFEAYNMASLWKLPVIFVCENNKYAMGTSVARGAATPDYYTRGDFVPGVRADGMDIFSVKETTKFAKEWCVGGNGPIILEFDAYRYSGHSMSDPGTTYRTRDEVSAQRESRDPIEKLRKKIVDAGVFSEEHLKNIELEVRKHVDEQLEIAKAAQEPSLDELWRDTYERNEISIRGVENKLIHQA